MGGRPTPHATFPLPAVSAPRSLRRYDRRGGLQHVVKRPWKTPDVPGYVTSPPFVGTSAYCDSVGPVVEVYHLIALLRRLFEHITAALAKVEGAQADVVWRLWGVQRSVLRAEHVR